MIKKKIITVLGTRPELIKLSPVLPLLDDHFNSIIVHTGQHYSYSLDRLFFEQLKIREPNYHLDIGSGTPAYQVGTMMMKIEAIALQEKPDLFLVQGDTNSTISTTLVAVKLGIPIAHIEAGYRSHNLAMSEEINRIVSDRFSRYLFVGIEEGVENLRKEGIKQEYIYLTGNTAVDALKRSEKNANNKILKNLKIESKKYAVVTVHRAENTVNSNLQNIVEALNIIAEKISIAFPIHPRTKEAIKKYQLTLSKKIIICEPLGYFEYIALMSNARFIMTDSGGVQEESVELNVPCLVLRNESEAQDLVDLGKNILTTTKKEEIVKLGELYSSDDDVLEKVKSISYPGKQGVAQKIVEILCQELYKKK